MYALVFAPLRGMIFRLISGYFSCTRSWSFHMLRLSAFMVMVGCSPLLVAGAPPDELEQPARRPMAQTLASARAASLTSFGFLVGRLLAGCGVEASCGACRRSTTGRRRFRSPVHYTLGGGSRFGRKPQDKGAIRSLMPPAVDFAGGLARLARLQALRCRSNLGSPLSPGFDFSLAASSLASFLGLCPPAAYSHCVCYVCACLADTPACRGFSRRLQGLGVCCRIVTLYILAFIMQKLSKIVLIQGRPIMRVQSL